MRVLAAGLFKLVFLAAEGSLRTFHASLVKSFSCFLRQNRSKKKLFSCDFIKRGISGVPECVAIVLSLAATLQMKQGLEEDAISALDQLIERGREASLL